MLRQSLSTSFRPVNKAKRGWISMRRAAIERPLWRFSEKLPSTFVVARSFSSSTTDFYSVLGGSRNDSLKDLKKKYRKMAMKYHPDSNQGNDKSHEKFQEINQAWEVLKDDKERKLYDQLGHESYKRYKETGGTHDPNQGGMNMGGFHDIFEDFFGGGFGQGSRSTRSGARTPRRGNDLHIQLELGFFEAVRGSSKTFSYQRNEKCSPCNGKGTENGDKEETETCGYCKGSGRVQNVVNNMMLVQETCPRCNGQGMSIKNKCTSCQGVGVKKETAKIEDLNIPPGVDYGMQLQKSGGGDFGPFGGPAGNLIIDLVVRPDPTGRFARNGLNLNTVVPISLVQSLLGDDIDLDNAYEKKLNLKIAPGTMHKQTLRLRGEGVRYGQQKGDLLVKIDVQPVEELSDRQKEILLEFEKIEEEKRSRASSTSSSGSA